MTSDGWPNGMMVGGQISSAKHEISTPDGWTKCNLHLNNCVTFEPDSSLPKMRGSQAAKSVYQLAKLIVLLCMARALHTQRLVSLRLG